MLDSHLLKCFLYKTIKHKFNQRLHEIGRKSLLLCNKEDFVTVREADHLQF